MQKSRYFDLLNRSRYWAAFAANEFAETVSFSAYTKRATRASSTLRFQTKWTTVSRRYRTTSFLRSRCRISHGYRGS